MHRSNERPREIGVDFNGRLVWPDSPAYDAARQLVNGMFDRRPLVVAQCSGVADVVSALRYARAHALPVSIRGGGHAVEGSSMADGALAIDLSPMNGVLVDPARRRATVQGGACWRLVDRETQLHGLAVTGGTVSDTGVAGLTLGGGLGWTARKYGATVDSLVGVEGVSVNGEVVRADDDENAELFWGVRGGGGNFIVVTSFDFQLHPVGPIVLAGPVMHPRERACEALRFFRDFMDTAPDEVMAIAFVMRAPRSPDFPPSTHGQLTVQILMAYIGDLDRAEQALRPLRAWGPPLVDRVEPMAYTALQQIIEVHLPQRGEARIYEKGGYLPALSDAVIDAILEGLERSPARASQTRDGVQAGEATAIWRLGGALTRVAPSSTSFNRTDAEYMYSLLALWDDPSEDDRWISATRQRAADVQAYSSSTAYLNLTIDRDNARIRDAYGPDHYRRLVALKRRWDPQNVLRFNKNIHPNG